MPIGVFVNSSSVLIGGLIGATMGSLIPERIRVSLMTYFGICAMSMGISYIVRVNTLPAVMMSIIIGLAIGELIYLEKGIIDGVGKIRAPLEKLLHIGDKVDDPEEFMTKFISLVVLFCASGTGIFGSIESGMTGDHTTLITKSVMDFFTAIVFSISLGPLVALICIPQAIIMLTLFFGSTHIYPLTTEVMRADFTACGGILTMAAGFRISGIKNFPIANMIPAMALVMPISYLWSTYISRLI